MKIIAALLSGLALLAAVFVFGGLLGIHVLLVAVLGVLNLMVIKTWKEERDQ